VKKLIYTISIFFVLIGFGFLYSYYNFQFWTHVRTDNFKSLAEYKGKNLNGFRGRQILVHRDFYSQMSKIENSAKKNKIKLIIIQSYRFDNQIINKPVVKPSQKSNHLAGFAIDFNVICNGSKYLSKDLEKDNLNGLPEEIHKFIKDIRDDKNLRWGGDFLIQDPIHIDSPLNIDRPTVWLEYLKACYEDFSNAIPKWKIWK
jgi:hypothetical protein